MTEIKYTLKCPQCGGTKFKATSAKPRPSDTVTCARPGRHLPGHGLSLGAAGGRPRQHLRAWQLDVYALSVDLQ